MQATIDGTTYRSRPKLLLGFFKRSRDNWKEKCKRIRAELKLAKNQIRAVEQSRANWRTQAKELESEVQRLQREVGEQKCRRSRGDGI